MAFVFKRLVLLLSIAAVVAAAKDSTKPQVQPAASYSAHQTNSKVTIGVEAVVSDEASRPFFGKHNPYKYGVLPILVVIQNDSSQTIRVDGMKLEYTVPNRSRVYATPAKDVRYLIGPNKPNVATGPTGGTRIWRKKNPLNTWEIEGRAFAAQMIPPGQSASGFYYFQTGFQNSASLYITGLKDAGSGKDLFYYEIPLADARK